MTAVITEHARPRGDVFALTLDARRFPTYDSFRAVVNTRQGLSDELCRQLLRDRVATAWTRAVKPRRIARWDLPRPLWRKGNLMVTVGLQGLVTEVLNGTVFQMLYCGVGSSNTAPALADTDLGTPISPRVGVTAAYASSSGTTAIWDTFFPTSANAGTWWETGMFTAASAGTMGNHALFGSSITKSTANTQIVEHQWVF